MKHQITSSIIRGNDPKSFDLADYIISLGEESLEEYSSEFPSKNK